MGGVCCAQPAGRVHVPFVGCKADGQAGPAEAPAGATQTIRIDPKLAEKLAYYKSGRSPGVLAPRGWFCLGVYGSGGEALLVTREPVNVNLLLSSKWGNLTGLGVNVDLRYGYTSGRHSVARAIARVFPKYDLFVKGVFQDFGVDPDLTYGPYPGDLLSYKTDRLVEYRTPPNSEGLGTMSSFLKPNEQPIHGLAALIGSMPELNLLVLSVRLPAKMNSLQKAMIDQLEHEAADGLR